MLKNLRRRDFLKHAAGLAGAGLLAGCGGLGGAGPTAVPAQTTPTAAPGATVAQLPLLRFAWWTDTGNMTPFQVSTSGPGGAVLLSLIFDTLTWKDEQGIIPWLASEWSAAPDGQSYTFRV